MRSRVRFKTDITAKVTCLNSPGPSIKGRLANLSAHGLSLILSRELPAGSAVRVEWGNTKFMGEVIYCLPYKDEFLVGLRVEDPVYDSGKASQSERNAT
jgi:hypothetical protein